MPAQQRMVPRILRAGVRKPPREETAFIALSRTDIVKGVVQVVKKHGGENNHHYPTRMDTFWMVLKGRVRFYGPGDVVLGQFGPHAGMVTPRFCRYWYDIGEEDLELLQVAAYANGLATATSHQRRSAAVSTRDGEYVQR